MKMTSTSRSLARSALAVISHEQNNPPPDNQEKTITQSNEDEKAQATGKDDAAIKGDVIGT